MPMPQEARLAAFEQMLIDAQRSYDDLTARLEQLKAEGKTKTATFRQYLGNKLTYQYLLSLYRDYGLLDKTTQEVSE